MTARIVYDRSLRIINPLPSETLCQALRELGLLELSERNWLKLPKEEAAVLLRNRMERQLDALPPSGEIADMEVLDPTRDLRFYKGRWVRPKKESGHFVARRPQVYGAPIWGFALLSNGKVTKFLDFPLKKDRWRGCDFAWHLQMAVDACRGSPQRYRRRLAPEGRFLDFFGPLPLWAQRRLAIVGRPADPYRCLLSYALRDGELPAEEDFLQKRLWLVPDNEPHEGG